MMDGRWLWTSTSPTNSSANRRFSDGTTHRAFGRSGKHESHGLDDAEIEDIATRRPRLAIALLQLLVQRSMDFGSRIESFSVDNIARRLARALIRFSERLGHEAEDGSVQMIPFTHELLSQYVGTSREIVTHYMNQFRRQGYLRSRERAYSPAPQIATAGLAAAGTVGGVTESGTKCRASTRLPYARRRMQQNVVTLSGPPASLAAAINSAHFSLQQAELDSSENVFHLRLGDHAMQAIARQT